MGVSQVTFTCLYLEVGILISTQLIDYLPNVHSILDLE